MAMRIAAVASCLQAVATGATVQSHRIVAQVSAFAPSMPTFTLEATLPIPPGVYVPGQSTVPLAVVSGGQPVPTQLAVVSRYPRPSDGADVVEIIARVERPAGVAPGEEIVFDVVTSPSADGPVSPPPSVQNLLASRDGLILSARDLHGNIYTANLLNKVQTRHPSMRVVRDGRLLR
jgi:hypothetical protein